MLNAKKIITDSNIAFGTSGARGLVVDFTHDVCAAFTHAFLSVIESRFNFDTVSLAIDNRPSSYEIAQACAFAIKQHGFAVEYHGVIPTPALAHYSMQENIPCIMVTGSHIPFERNGLKFYRPDGEITKEDEVAIVNSKYLFSPLTSLPQLEICYKAAEAYIARYTSLFDKNILKGKKIGIYEHSSAGRDLYGPLFRLLGAEIISLGRSDQFVPIDTEAVADDDRIKARKWSTKYKLDAIFSTDGDGDRPLVADENGEWLRGDILGLLASLELGIEALAIPVNCNSAIELSDKFKHVTRTKIGSPYVISAFNSLYQRYDAIAGFEANGGSIVLTDLDYKGSKICALPTRDALLPALMLFVAARKENVSNLLKKIPARYTWSDRLQNYPKEKSKQLITRIRHNPNILIDLFKENLGGYLTVDNTDGVRIIIINRDILHIRASGNAPEIRCYAESCTEQKAKEYVNILIKFLESQ